LSAFGGSQNDELFIPKKMKPTISIIAALSENRVIGNKGQIPWHIAEDMKRFKELTTGHPVIMGRKTFESIGKPLPNRTNIIITSNPDYHPPDYPPDEWNSLTPPDLHTVHSLNEALELAKKHEQNEIFIIGGGKIYQQALSIANKLYLTLVKGNFSGDTFFPDYSEFNRVLSKENSKNAEHEYSFLELSRG